MNNLKEHKYMDALTTLSYLIAFIIFVIMLVTQNYILLVVAVIEIFALRLIGYGIDRIIENNN